MASFGSRLVLLRHHLNLTQVEASKLCGLDDGSWSNWERGGRPRRMDEVVESIANATGCNRVWLMWGSTQMYEQIPSLSLIRGGLPEQLAFAPLR